MGPALFGGWIGGGLFAGLALWSGLGWLAALVAYSLGGALLLLVIAALPLIEARPRQPALRPACRPHPPAVLRKRRRPARGTAPETRYT